VVVIPGVSATKADTESFAIYREHELRYA
jgi:hypothetical protein